MVLKVKQSIFKIESYVPGKSTPNAIKLSSNENALGASGKAIQAFKDCSEYLFKYPDGSAKQLRTAIASKIGLGLQDVNVVIGAGSDEIFSMLSTTLLQEGDNIVQSEYGFLMYAIYAYSHGAEVVRVKDTDFTANLNAMLSAVNNKTKIVYLANPNNPTGTMVDFKQIKDFFNKLPPSVVLVLDLAYKEYATSEGLSELYKLCIERDNLVITQTFSKAYGLAALRVGYCICSKWLADVINRVRGPFNTAAPSQAACVAALADDDFIAKSLANNDTQKLYLYSQLDSLGFAYLKTEANFIMFDAKDKAAQLDEFLTQNGIVIRRLEAYNLNSYLRVSIGTPEQNAKFVEALQLFAKL